MSSSQSRVRYELFVGVDIAAATASAVWQPSANKPSKAITIEQTLSDLPLSSAHPSQLAE